MNRRERGAPKSTSFRLDAAGIAVSRSPPGRLIRWLMAGYVCAVVLLSYQVELSLVAKALAACVAVGFIYCGMAGARRISLPGAYMVWGAWALLATTMSFLATDPHLAASKALTVLQVLTVGFALTQLLIWEGRTDFYVKAIVASALAACALVWLDPARFSGYDGRVFGPLGNANAFGAMLVTGFIFALVRLASNAPRVTRLGWLVLAGIVVVMMMQTGSRQALLGALVSSLVVLGFHVYRSGAGMRRWLHLVGGLLLLLGAGTWLASSSDYWFRMEALLTFARGDVGDTDTSLLERAHLYGRTLELFREAPLLGVGLDNFRVQPRFVGAGPIGMYSHSNYAEILVGTGLLGFMLYFSVFALWIVELWRLRHLAFHEAWCERYLRVVVVTLTYLAMDVATVSYYDKFVWLIYPLVIAELHLMGRLTKVCLPGRPIVAN